MSVIQCLHSISGWLNSFVLHIMYRSTFPSRPLRLPTTTQGLEVTARLSCCWTFIAQLTGATDWAERDTLGVKGLTQSWNMRQSEGKAPTEKCHIFTSTSFNNAGKSPSTKICYSFLGCVCLSAQKICGRTCKKAVKTHIYSNTSNSKQTHLLFLEMVHI